MTDITARNSPPPAPRAAARAGAAAAGRARSSGRTAAPAKGPLAAGAAAPPFGLRCGPYREARLEDYRGRPLVLVFYVADWHPVCTAQLDRVRDAAPDIAALGAALVAISADTLWSHAVFARARCLPFPLLADDRPRGAVARAYGVYDAAREAPRRALFVVDGGGTIVWSAAFPEALDPGVDDVLTALEALPPGHPAPPVLPPEAARVRQTSAGAAPAAGGGHREALADEG